MGGIERGRRYHSFRISFSCGLKIVNALFIQGTDHCLFTSTDLQCRLTYIAL